MVRLAVDADCAIVNGGSLRIDGEVPVGVLEIGTIVKIFPFLDFVVMLEMTGEVLIEALENGVSKYPSYEGRFPCVSQIKFAFNP